MPLANAASMMPRLPSSTLVARSCGVSVLLLFCPCQHLPLSVHELPRTEHSVVIDVPPAMQDELYACGLASVSSLCAYYGVEIPQAERERLAALARADEGLSGAE